MLTYADKNIIEFVDEWGDKIYPQLKNTKFHDLTEIFSKTKKSKMILNSISEGKKIFVVGYKNCRGMIKKWLYDNRGRMIREKGRGIVEINPTTITMAAIDINVPFVTSDEVLLVNYPKDKPYNLEKEIVKESMKKIGLNFRKDIIFIFFLKEEEAKTTINRFVDDLKHVINKEYCRAKGIIAIKDPKWLKYHASDEITKYTNSFFFGGVRLTYSRREALKNKKWDFKKN